MGSEEIQLVLTSALHKGTQPRPLYPRERTPDTHRTGDWVGPSAGLDVSEETTFTAPARNQTPDRAASTPVLGSISFSPKNLLHGVIWDHYFI